MIQPTTSQIEFVKDCLNTGFDLLEKNTNLDPNNVDGLSMSGWLSLVSGISNSGVAALQTPEGPYVIDPGFYEYQRMRHAIAFGVGMAVQLEIVANYNPEAKETKEG